MTSPESGGFAALDIPERDPVAPASPDGFRLGAEPPRVMRLSRKALASIGAAAGVGIGGALLWALQPVAPKAPTNLYRADAKNRAEVVTGAPADYGAVPKLGPPLPGDLGRPIVAAQAAGEEVPVPPMGGTAADRPSPAEQARERAAREGEAARASRLFLGSGTATTGVVGEALPAIAAPAGSGPIDAASDTRRAFLAGGPREASESAERIKRASSAYILQAGSVIPAALITGIRSDLPGQVTAQVTENVYDSPTGRILLIPQGARLIGEYDSEVGAGQERVLLTWDRLILPGGASIALARQPGADASGMAGLSDRTDHHWGRLLRAAFVSTLLGVGAELGSDADDRFVRALREGTQDATGEAGRKLVERELRIAPTLTIRPGFAIRVLVTRDLVLEPVTAGKSL